MSGSDCVGLRGGCFTAVRGRTREGENTSRALVATGEMNDIVLDIIRMIFWY